MLNKYFIRALSHLRQQLSSCELCGQKCSHLLQICQYCYQDLPQFNLKLIKGDLLNWPAVNTLLGKQRFDHLFCLAPYDWPFSSWITQCKYHQRFELTTLFSQLLYQHWQTLRLNHQVLEPDLIMSVPMHINRWKNRGFNQAHLIAKRFSKQAGIDYGKNILIRHKDTTSQVGTSGVARRKNIKGAISLNLGKKSLPDHVMLIDDVITTGATANEICRLLKSHGVKTVTLLTLCISLPSEKESKKCQ